jgi:hypothetical protein
VTEEGFRLFYRIVRDSPPSLWDFTSGKARQTREPIDPERREVWDGLSVFSTLSQARRKRRTSPGIGQYIAVLRVPLDGSVRMQCTLRDDGHHTLWASPAKLRGLVLSVDSA